MTTTRALIIMIIAFACLLGAAPGHAQARQQMEIILDASGSMWGQVNQEAKIGVAKRVLIDLVEQLKGREDLELAIRVYGHQSPREQRDCKDSKLELPFAPPDPQAVRALTERIKAKGYTPIAYSLLQAKKDFGSGELKRSIVLITDGLESCEGDPCRVARELAAKGLEVKLHVVGFDLKEQQLQKLKCLVEPSSGLLLGAGDAKQLQTALDEVVKKALAENLVVRVVDEKDKPLHAQIQVIGQDGKPKDIRSGKRVGFKLPPGLYSFLVKGPNGAQKKLTGITLEESQLREIKVKLELATLIVGAMDQDGSPAPLVVRLERKTLEGGYMLIKGRHAEDKPAEFRLPAGDYRMEVQHRDTREKVSLEPFTLQSCEHKEYRLTFNRAKLVVSGQNPEGGPVAMRVFVQKKSPTGDYKHLIARDAGEKPAEFDLEPGQYRLKVHDRKTGAEQLSQPFSLATGEQKTLNFKFGKARLLVAGKTPEGQPVAMRVFVQQKDGQGNYKHVTARDAGEKPAEFDLEPGEYRLKILNRNTRAEQSTAPFSLQNGQQKVMNFTFGKAKLTVWGKTPDGTPAPMRVYVQIKSPSGDYKHVTARDAGDKPAEFELEPGDYRLKINHRKTRAEQFSLPFRLENGQQLEMSFTFGKARLLVSGQTPEGEQVALRVFVQKQKETGGFQPLTARNAGAKPAQFDLSPGDYRVKVHERATKAEQLSQPFSLQNGEQKTLQFTLGFAELSVSAADASGQPLSVEARAEMKTETGMYKTVARIKSGSDPARFRLAPGSYRLQVLNPKTREKRLIEDLILKHGDRVHKKVVFE